MPACKTTITRNNMTVDCYGDWKEDSNCLVVGDYASGEEMEEIFADGAESWADAVEQLTAWAARCGHTIVELQAC